MPEPMTMMALATAGSAGLSFLGSSRASSEQRSASKRAVRSNEILTREERARQDRLLAEQREDFRPWRERGEEALGLIADGIQTGTYDPPVFDVGDVDLDSDPGYQFRMDEANRAIENSAAARGGSLSGATLRALTRYNQDAASQEYRNAYARYSDQIDREGARRLQRYNMLSRLSDQGLSAAARQSNATSQNALTSRALTESLRSGNAQQYNIQGNAAAEGIRGGVTAINQGLQNWLTYRQSNPGTTTAPNVTTNRSNALAA